MELLRSERDGPVAVGGVPQHGEASPDLRDWNDLDALGGHGVYRYARCTVPVVEQDLHEQATEGVAHDNRRALQLAYDTLVVLHDCGDRQRLDRGGVLVQRLYLYLKAGVGRSEHPIAAALVALDPVLPASWGHPEPMDQDDGVWSTRIRGVVLSGHGVLLLSSLHLDPQCASREISPHPPVSLTSENSVFSSNSAIWKRERVGYARHQSRLKEVNERAHPTDHDDTVSGSDRATFLKA